MSQDSAKPGRVRTSRIRKASAIVLALSVIALLYIVFSGSPAVFGEVTIVDNTQPAEIVLAGGASVIVPPYSLPIGSTVSMSKLNPDQVPPLPEGFANVGPIYAINADQPIETMVTIRIPFPEVIGESVFQLSRYHEGHWRPIPFAVDGGYAIVDTDALSLWGWLEVLNPGLDLPTDWTLYPSGATRGEVYIESIHPDSGAGGTVVTISGSNLKAPALYRYITFGGLIIGESGTLSWTDDTIVLQVPSRSRDVLGRPPLQDNRVGVKVGPNPSSNTVAFTYKEPVLDNIDPKSGEAGTTVTLAGEHFGDGKHSAVRFGVSRAEIRRWDNKEIVVVAPDDLGLGIGLAKDTLNLALLALTLGSQTLLDDAIAALDAIIPDAKLDEIVWKEDDPLHVQFGNVVYLLLGEALPFVTIEVQPGGFLVVPVVVETGVGDTHVQFFTYTPVHEITFPDRNLEAAIREAIDMPTGPIYLSHLLGLTSLHARERDIKDLTGLEYCTSLTSINLMANGITDISPLSDLRSMESLNLGNNQISDISPLADLTGLTTLELWTNQISYLSPLARLTSLSELDLSNNRIVGVLPLASLVNLTELHLGFNQISDVSPLASLTSLTGLAICCNEIEYISPVANLTRLVILSAEENRISDASPVANLVNLEVLWLADNQISDISSLANLTKLEALGLGNNQIRDISPLVDNTGLGMSDFVDLENNPLSSVSIDTYIPRLQARGVMVFW